MRIINATIQPVSSPKLENGYILVRDGRIDAVGPMADCPGDSETIDLAGKTIYPGFIDAHCHLGMWEDSLGFEGDDGNEDTDPVTPHLRALDAINPLDRSFREAAAAGVTTVVTGPGSANPIGGSWVAIKTAGRRIDDMIVKSPVGIKFALGENPKSTYNDKNQMPVTRMATAALIREQLEKAKHYISDLESAMQDEDLDEPEFDAKCEALRPLLGRDIKAFFHAHRADDIFTALRISREFGLDSVIVHATDGHLIADLLEEEGVPVIVGPLICDRSKPELRGQSVRNPAALQGAGVPEAICTDHPEVPIQYLPLSCGLAVREGMDPQEALRSITLRAAQICGIEDQVGSIEPGKDADFVVYPDGIDPFSVYAKPEQVFCKGTLVYQQGQEV